MAINTKKYIEQFLQIRTKSAEVVPLRLNAPQQKLYAALAAQARAGKPLRAIVLKARQMGFSTLTEAMIDIICMRSWTRTEILFIKKKMRSTPSRPTMLKGNPSVVRPHLLIILYHNPAKMQQTAGVFCRLWRGTRPKAAPGGTQKPIRPALYFRP